jgi:riboflavin biosynthesis pyrimidine reductase
MQHVAEFNDEQLEALYMPPARRHVRAGFIASLDGAVELDGRSGSLGGDDDHRVFVTLRALCDVILVGSNTAQTENYGPAKLSADRQARRRARGQSALPPIAVVSATASLDPAARLFVGDGAGAAEAPRPLVLCSARAPKQRRQVLAEVATVIECGDEHVEPGLALAALAERGLRTVLCEGGPTLAGVLINAHLLDELCLTQAMILAGPQHQLLAAGAPFVEPLRLRLGHLILGDGVLLGRWEVER